MANGNRAEVTGLPEGGPVTLALVKTELGITDTRDDDRLTTITAAVNRVVRSWPCATAAAGASTWDEAGDVVQGSVMLAARLFRRKASPAGVEAFGSQGAAYVMRNDPDIALLLQVGAYAPPVIG